MLTRIKASGVCVLVLLASSLPTDAAQVTVNTVDGLRNALLAAQPGDQINVAPGTYTTRLWVSGVNGAPGNLIKVVASDPNNRPLFDVPAAGCFTLYNCSYILVDGVIAQGAAASGGNGIELTNSHHMILKNSVARNLVNQGNSDAFKHAGSSNILMYNCRAENWAAGGSGVDIMNNHNSLFMRNTITYPTMPPGAAANGFQPKSNNAYELGFYRNTFIDGSSRAQQFGGSSGATAWEGRDMVAMGNVFEGGEAAVAFVSCTRCDFDYNTVKNPENWVMRILNENSGVGPAYYTAYNKFRRNIVQYGPLSSIQNVGSNTLPATFTYAENYWYNSLDPAHSIPVLPGGETNPAGGTNPQLNAEFRPLYGPAKEYGAFAPGMEAAFGSYVGWFQWAWDQAMILEPDARPGGTYAVGPGGRTYLDGSGSYAGVGSYGPHTITSYLWDLDYDGYFDDGSGAAGWVSYSYLVGVLGLGPGAHRIELRISSATEYGAMADYGLTTLYVTSLVGDADGDGDVDFTDYQALETNFGVASGATWSMGDFDGDGDVDFTDYQALEVNFGTSVPEPGTIALLMAGGVAALGRRRAN